MSKWMKLRMLALVITVLAAVSCNNSESVQQKADSISRKIDTAGKKVWDSAKQEMKELKNKVEDRFKKDSTDK